MTTSGRFLPPDRAHLVSIAFEYLTERYERSISRIAQTLVPPCTKCSESLACFRACHPSKCKTATDYEKQLREIAQSLVGEEDWKRVRRGNGAWSFSWLEAQYRNLPDDIVQAMHVHVFDPVPNETALYACMCGQHAKRNGRGWRHVSSKNVDVEETVAIVGDVTASYGPSYTGQCVTVGVGDARRVSKKPGAL